MAKTYFEYPGDGVRTVYPVSFVLGYLQQQDVYVFVGTDPTVQVNYSWQDSASIELDAAPAIGTTLTIRRIAARDGAINDYQNGAVLEENNLDNSFAQGLMIDEELEDGFATDVIQQQDMNFGDTYGVSGLRDPVEPRDAVHKTYVDTLSMPRAEQLEYLETHSMKKIDIEIAIERAIRITAGLMPLTNQDNGFIYEPITDVQDNGSIT
jgi:hypothetical protein